MKLASLKSGGRDGTLIVVSRDLTRAIEATGIAPTLQAALEDWMICKPKLEALYRHLESGNVTDAFPFSPAECSSPLPRAYQWIDGSAYLHHAELVRKARNAEMPESLYSDPLVYQGASDSFIGPSDDILIADETAGIDLEGEVAIITDDVPMGTTREEAVKHVQLLMIVNDVSLRNLMPNELAKGFGFFTSKPATAFSPVAVTPDELAEAWDGAKICLPLICEVNGAEIGRPNAGVDLYFDFPALIEHAASTRELEAGTIIGSGTVSNRDTSAGSACLQEMRMLEKIVHGEMRTPHLKFGDRVRIDMQDKDGASIFGAIEQSVVQYSRKS
ncbi:fumarylacetoacetate hydrolase family protein (plasmid) [Cupriavidus necator]|uniref:FAA hydrolase family protein n=1 Tax=Cupriavidus necator TaxID=106590 RepID=A0A367P8B7_CUPNE|nr:fumarylacetoacetate hydrolase family protein [Cupriavidus necator]QQX89553.1 fumarylacetoacetate hydrolase family protein [Cupriavidus necator]RCJ04088.1 FAA hydrolase family protein [Cupriavidus necator]